MSWISSTINDLCLLVTDGAHHSPKEVNNGYPMASSKDMLENDFDFSNIKNISEDEYIKLVNGNCKPLIGDVLLIKDGNSYLKKIFTIKEEREMVVLSSIAILRPNSAIIDPLFFQYALRNPDTKKFMENFVSGSAIPRIVLKDFKSMKLDIPVLTTQKRIANILSSYDDLIENNLKRIKLLEETAQNIYKEWFVNFRFPNYEHTGFDEESGLPVGWEKINLYDFVEVKMGFPFKAEDFNEDFIGKPAIRIRDIPSSWTRTYTTQEVSEEYIVEQGDILIGMDGFFYLDIWRGQKGYLVQRVCRIKAKEQNLQGFLLESLRQPISYYEKTISGATVAHLGAKHLKEIFLNVPKDNLLLKELEVFNKLNLQKINLSNQNQKLKEARDILLPRLMNRTIEV